MCRWEGYLLSTGLFFPLFKILKLNSNDTLMVQETQISGLNFSSSLFCGCADNLFGCLTSFLISVAYEPASSPPGSLAMPYTGE